MDGYFNKGIITIKESHLNSLLKPKTIYLLLRAFQGMNKYHHKIQDIKYLN
jgi:hypothetical protein